VLVPVSTMQRAIISPAWLPRTEAVASSGSW
jgi:hypothetical protein